MIRETPAPMRRMVATRAAMLTLAATAAAMTVATGIRKIQGIDFFGNYILDSLGGLNGEKNE